MDLNNIKRNQLDYILTDILPVELSELYTYKFFYQYLSSKNDSVKEMIKEIVKCKNNSSINAIPFNGSSNWTTIPLKYMIMKTEQSEREISLLQPMAAIELFLFVSAYQKELLNILEKNSYFSLRYHHRNNDLCYKTRNKAITRYFPEESRRVKKDILQQTGMFFDIKPFKSISSFTSSEEWFNLNIKYKYFIRTDYKACFDSIYTHTFKWLVGKDVNDTKNFKNVNMYTVIDRILQNVNSRTSNGIVVGPEFSRMIAEILLQGIDSAVHNTLLNDGYVNGFNYHVYRYVDDIFVFAESEKLADIIVKQFSEASSKYLLRLNENKLCKKRVPFVLDEWLNETNLFVNRVSNILFTSKDEQKNIIENLKENTNEENFESIKAYIFKDSMFSLMKPSLIKQFNKLICEFEEKNKTIVSYFLGMLLNKVKRNKTKVNIFRDKISEKIVYGFLDFVWYIYSYYPDFNNTQKLLSIISYVRDEFELFEDSRIVQKLINKYAFIFGKANLSDIINLILFCSQAKVEIPFREETGIVDRLRKNDNPILWASYLIYSRYNEKYFSEVKQEIEEILIERMDSILCKESIYTYREFWWLLVFNKSPHIGVSLQNTLDNIINTLKVSNNINKTAGELCGNLFIDFLKNSPEQFFEWNIENRDFLRDITFKTYERTIFKNYRDNLNFMDWSSL